MSDASYHYGNMSEAAAQPDVTDPYASLGELGYSEHETAAAREVLEDVIGQSVEQAVGPLQQELDYVTSQLESQENEEALYELEERYPALQRDDIAEEVLVQARDVAEELGLRPEAAMAPEVIELAYLRSVVAGGGQTPAAGRTRESRGRDNGRGGLMFDGDSPEAREFHEQIKQAAGPQNFWGW